MASSKVTDFTAATSVNSADVLYLIQNGLDKKLTIATLLANLPSTLVKTSGLVALGGTSQLLPNSGVINATTVTTYITNTANSQLTISAGTQDGQLKIVVMTSGTHASTIVDLLGGNKILSKVGDSVVLMWSQQTTKWCVLSSNI